MVRVVRVPDSNIGRFVHGLAIERMTRLTKDGVLW